MSHGFLLINLGREVSPLNECPKCYPMRQQEANSFSRKFSIGLITRGTKYRQNSSFGYILSPKRTF